MAEFEWDPAKEAQNIEKHGIDFSAAKLIWDGSVLEQIDTRREYGEARYQAFGAVEDRVLTVIFGNYQVDVARDIR